LSAQEEKIRSAGIAYHLDDGGIFYRDFEYLEGNAVVENQKAMEHQVAYWRGR
jgi:hypothetical protein